MARKNTFNAAFQWEPQGAESREYCERLALIREQNAARLLSAGYTRSAEYLGWWVSPSGEEMDEFTAIKRLGEVIE